MDLTLPFFCARAAAIRGAPDQASRFRNRKQAPAPSIALCAVTVNAANCKLARLFGTHSIQIAEALFLPIFLVH